ncbi:MULTISPECIES: hypothetical protein [Gammaproteobacteria]|nr:MULTISPECIES: hypothetical protein [Gammaproteobacteria]ELB1542480.1 hypothetical protein [Proteus mirabilis]ELB1542770.1 hypothetical protein [Proteus mirabilis]EMD9371342.1 hypothetical protein [Proteus mirabilis]EMD9371620.1 hypothetical protein [Proteus mirabilis]MEA5325444.1 hypothetical protein [Proteus mirabilis]
MLIFRDGLLDSMMGWYNYFRQKLTMTTHHAKNNVNRRVLVKANQIDA